MTQKSRTDQRVRIPIPIVVEIATRVVKPSEPPALLCLEILALRDSQNIAANVIPNDGVKFSPGPPY